MLLLLCLFSFLGIFFSFSKDLLFRTKLLRNEGFVCMQSQGEVQLLRSSLPSSLLDLLVRSSNREHPGTAHHSLLTHRDHPSSTLLSSDGVTLLAFLDGCGSVSSQPYMTYMKMVSSSGPWQGNAMVTFWLQANGFWKTNLVQVGSKCYPED